MSGQLDLLAAVRPAVEGMTVAATHADPADIRAVRGHVERFAVTLEPFTSEQVSAMLSDAQRDRLAAFPNATGGVYFHLARARVIRGVGYQPATRPEARGHLLRVWVGVRNGNG